MQVLYISLVVAIIESLLAESNQGEFEGNAIGIQARSAGNSGVRKGNSEGIRREFNGNSESKKGIQQKRGFESIKNVWVFDISVTGKRHQVALL